MNFGDASPIAWKWADFTVESGPTPARLACSTTARRSGSDSDSESGLPAGSRSVPGSSPEARRLGFATAAARQAVADPLKRRASQSRRPTFAEWPIRAPDCSFIVALTSDPNPARGWPLRDGRRAVRHRFNGRIEAPKRRQNDQRINKAHFVSVADAARLRIPYPGWMTRPRKPGRPILRIIGDRSARSPSGLRRSGGFRRGAAPRFPKTSPDRVCRPAEDCRQNSRASTRGDSKGEVA